ncbi:membrane dipeptidase [Thalassomonas viridans]|uniref:Membrane dipeptidase n=1 Tax=Thalassomonas viridans TaxID=137584 RepID=A0AAF0C7T1_9GAMM|nr:dipeptidase [Thalassomonas viridans]WDE03495.1 membrane dipeptidase [Thalassomonas viridans]
MKTLSKNKSKFTLPVPLVLAIALGLSGCQSQQAQQIQSHDAPASLTQMQQARTIAQKYLIADTHIDVPYRLEEAFEDVSEHTAHGDFDYPRAVAGGLNAPFMSIYTPAALEQSGGSKVLADKLIDMVETMVKAAPDKFALAYSTRELEQNFARGLMSFPLGMENGSPIEGDLTNLQHFYDRGIRYITLAHSKANHISDSSYDSERPAGGLTEFGKKLVTEMNKLGVMVDISHVSDDAFYQVMAISKVPVIASHSSARHFTPGFERNMDDDMIKALAKNGGVIQINFGSTFISQASIENYNAFKKARATYMEANNLSQDSAEVAAFEDEYRAKKPFVYATLDDVLDHFDHVVKLVGIEHVGIGSDYDGVGDSLPQGLKDVSTYPNLIAGLLKRGYSEQEIVKILSGNLIRVWREAEAYAANH